MRSTNDMEEFRDKITLKTTPKIIGYVHTKKGKVDNIRCDNCNSKLKRHFIYCPTCGRHIDWKNTKDVSGEIYKTISYN